MLYLDSLILSVEINLYNFVWVDKGFQKATGLRKLVKDSRRATLSVKLKEAFNTCKLPAFIKNINKARNDFFDIKHRNALDSPKI